MKKIKMSEHMINGESKTILCGKTFIKNASKYGTPEYFALVGLKRDFSDYKTIVVEPKKAEAKMSTKGLTREFMEFYIKERFGEDSQDYASYQGIKQLCGESRSSYMTMRKWFIEK